MAPPCVTSDALHQAEKARVSSEPAIITMFKACRAGDLGLSRSRGEKVGRRPWPAVVLDGWIRMAVASSERHLDVAKWLAVVSAPEANWLVPKKDGGFPRLTKPTRSLFNPMYVASYNGHLHVAKWLFAVGAAEQL